VRLLPADARVRDDDVVRVRRRLRLPGRAVDAARELVELALARLLVAAGLRIAFPGADVQERVAVGEVGAVVDADQALRVELALPVAGSRLVDVAGVARAARRVVHEVGARIDGEDRTRAVGPGARADAELRRPDEEAVLREAEIRGRSLEPVAARDEGE